MGKRWKKRAKDGRSISGVLLERWDLGLGDRLAGCCPTVEATCNRLHVEVAHVVQGGGGQRGAAAGFAVEQNVEVTRLQGRVGAELEFEHAARNVHGTGDVASNKFIGFADIHQYIGLQNGLFGFSHLGFLHAGFGSGNEVVGSFHRACSCQRLWSAE